MRQNVTNEKFASVKMYRRDEPIVVAADVEDEQIPYFIYARKCFAQLAERLEVSFANNFVPPLERSFALRMFLPKSDKRSFAEDMHITLYLKKR